MRNLKQKILVVLAVFSLLILPLATTALADSWKYRTSIAVQDTSGSDRAGVPVIINIPGQNLVDAGYVNSNATDTRIKEGTAEHDYLITNQKTVLFIPSLAANQIRAYNLHMGYSPTISQFGIIAGTGGYVTVSDDAALELGVNFEVEQSGWIDTTSGSNKNLVYKEDAFRTYVSADNEITSAIAGGVSSSVTLRPNAAGDATELIPSGAPTNWECVDDVEPDDDTTYVSAQGVGPATDYYNLEDWANPPEGAVITSVVVHFRSRYNVYQAYHTPILRLSAVDTGGGEVPLISTYISYSEAVARPGGGDWAVADINSLQVGAKLRSENASGYHAYCTQTYIVVNYTCDLAVTATGIASGTHTIKTTADGTDLKIFVDDVEKDSVALAGASVPDTAYSWYLGQNNVMPYMEYCKHTVSGALVVWYQPTTMISGTTLPDREGTAQNGTITWGSNSDLTVTIGSTTSLASTTSSTGAGAVADTVSPATMPEDWYGEGATMGNLPFYEQFSSAAVGMGMPTQSLYLMIMLGTASAVGLGVVLFTGSVLMAMIAAGFVISAGVGTSVLGWWMLFIFVVMAVGIMYLTRQM